MVFSFVFCKQKTAYEMRISDGSADVCSSDLRIIRFAWHATAVLMLISAATGTWPGTPKGLLAVIGAAWLATGVFNAVYTKGRHIAWPALSAAGLFALIGALS